LEQEDPQLEKKKSTKKTKPQVIPKKKSVDLESPQENKGKKSPGKEQSTEIDLQEVKLIERA